LNLDFRLLKYLKQLWMKKIYLYNFSRQYIIYYEMWFIKHARLFTHLFFFNNDVFVIKINKTKILQNNTIFCFHFNCSHHLKNRSSYLTGHSFKMSKKISSFIVYWIKNEVQHALCITLYCTSCEHMQFIIIFTILLLILIYRF